MSPVLAYEPNREASLKIIFNVKDWHACSMINLKSVHYRADLVLILKVMTGSVRDSQSGLLDKGERERSLERTASPEPRVERAVTHAFSGRKKLIILITGRWEAVMCVRVRVRGVCCVWKGSRCPVSAISGVAYVIRRYTLYTDTRVYDVYYSK